MLKLHANLTGHHVYQLYIVARDSFVCSIIVSGTVSSKPPLLYVCIAKYYCIVSFKPQLATFLTVYSDLIVLSCHNVPQSSSSNGILSCWWYSRNLLWTIIFQRKSATVLLLIIISYTLFLGLILLEGTVISC